MKSKILFVGYREWAESIHHGLDFKLPLATSTELFLDFINRNDCEHIFFVGWSEIIPNHIISKYKCYCIHPSELPKYRGGSPIQHQIINNELISAVTLFQMNEKLDAGPIISQMHFSLEGNLDDIFNRIIKISIVLIDDLLFKISNNLYISKQIQEETYATQYKRRRPSESEITLDSIKNSSSLQLYNKIRALSDPYPNAYIICGDGNKLFIKNVKL